MDTDIFKSHLHQDISNSPNSFGSIYCSGCELSWTWEFVPRYCPRCGAKVTDDPAPISETFNQKLKMAGCSFSKCPYCKNENYGNLGGPWLSYCPFCGGDLRLIQKASRLDASL